MLRRTFALGAATAALLPLRAQSADYRIEILPSEPIGRIAPELYGHFVEHLGGVVYDGIWVGERSKIANTGGLRQQLIDAFKAVKPSSIRWPGGCFADSYNWRDGVGPRNFRPRRANFWLDSKWPEGASERSDSKYDPNHFGTQEFLRFCELVGGEPYLAANLRSLSSRDFYEWVDYCNAPTGATTMAELRGSHGHPAPYNVRYWGVGNESWGCGGNFHPEEYAVEFRRFVEWVPKFGGQLSYVASGPNGDDPSWTRRFLGKIAERNALGRVWGFAVHHYSWNVSAGRTTNWDEGKGAALNYPLLEYYELLAEGMKMDPLLTRHWDIMAEVDRPHRIKLVVDEWGSWFRPGTESHPDHLLGQQSTMRDALLAALTFDIFHKHADKVAMANIAQLVNCLQALFLAHEDKFALTPTYHVFDMYKNHQGAEALRTLVAGATLRWDRLSGKGSLPGVSASASRQGKSMLVTLSNLDPANAHTCEVNLRGISSAKVTSTKLLTSGGDLNAHNSLSQPSRLAPTTPATPRLAGGTLQVTLPAASVQSISIELA